MGQHALGQLARAIREGLLHCREAADANYITADSGTPGLWNKQ